MNIGSLKITTSGELAITELSESSIGRLMIARLCPTGIYSLLFRNRYMYKIFDHNHIYEIIYQELLNHSIDRSVNGYYTDNIDDALYLISVNYGYEEKLIIKLLSMIKLAYRQRLKFNNRHSRITLLTELCSLTTVAESQIGEINPNCTQSILEFLGVKQPIFYKLAVAWILSYDSEHTVNHKYITGQVKFTNLTELEQISTKPLFQILLAMC